MSGCLSKGGKEPVEPPIFNCKWTPCKRKFTLKFLLEKHEILCPHNNLLQPTLSPAISPSSVTIPTSEFLSTPTSCTFAALTPPPTPDSTGSSSANITTGRKRKSDGSRVLLSTPKSTSSKPKVSCPKQCGKTFSRKSEATRHRKLCGLTDEEKKKAIKIRFGNDPTHVCCNCGEVFEQTNGKTAHEDRCALTVDEMKEKYKDDPGHFCCNCAQFFIDTSNRQQHERSCGVTKEEMMERFKDNVQHWCSKCDYFSVNVSNMSKHKAACNKTKEELMIEYRDDPKRWCSKCDYFSFDLTTLSRHEAACSKTKEELMIVYKDDPYHWCEQCGHLFFSDVRSQKLHKLRYHTHIDVRTITLQQMKVVHPLKHNNDGIGEEDPLDPLDKENFDFIVKKKLEWADTFAHNKADTNFVYRAACLSHSFSSSSTTYSDFVVGHPEEVGAYSGVKGKVEGLDIHNWHKYFPQKSKPGQAALRGQEIVFFGQTCFKGQDSATQARKQEALEINYGFYANKYKGEKMYYINVERELTNLSYNSDAAIMKMLSMAVRGEPSFCHKTECECPAYFHFELDKMKKVEFSSIDKTRIKKESPPRLPPQKARPQTEEDLKREIDRLFRSLKEEMRLNLETKFNVYSVLIVNKADFPGMSDPCEILVALRTRKGLVVWCYSGKGVEAADGNIHAHHQYGESTIMNELEKGDKIAIKIARMRCSCQRDAEEKEAFLQYTTGVSSRKKSHGIRIVPINIRMEWTAWLRLSDPIRKLAQECGELGTSLYSFADHPYAPLYQEGEFVYPIDVARQVEKGEVAIVKFVDC
ncbi:uncharacterized protein LOC110842952 [Folsomia candida]|uniref:Zinc finger protein 2 n=1 Tax=Folsomia candida TaxID=158441 RepID=A0A226ETJ5_FOLCA|nr:uncharacterized protein LOC110842952 [Folsomia candida]OXA60384.1 Zinc finger protein 2 [Folsomia candida]